ncbi:MAG TPA: acyltransferase [Pseudorhodoplanes sp.]|nr:acyltransferase [Pseudorhodoplanes sp.]
MHAPSKIAAPNGIVATAAQVRSRGENSYDFVRFCAASFVLFSHHFDLAGRPEPQVPGLGEDFGELGVEIFFCLSGFLICQSLQRNPDWAHFIAARVLRIFPNLAFVLVVTSVVTLVWYGNYANLWAHAGYVIGNLLLFVNGVTLTLPGIFTDAVRAAVNEPLWTLPYELWCYALLFLMFAVSSRRSGICVIVGVLAIGIAWTATSAAGETNVDSLNGPDFFRLGAYFLSGSTLALFWPRIEKNALAIGLAGLAGAFAVRNLAPVDTILVSFTLACAVIGLGNSGAMGWFSKGGDASYGMYVFAWPVQQFAHLLIGSFWLSLVAAFLITTAIGYGTWHGFEKRAMAHRGQMAEWARGRRFRRAET